MTSHSVVFRAMIAPQRRQRFQPMFRFGHETRSDILNALRRGCAARRH